jgi:hypothetical protein
MEHGRETAFLSKRRSAPCTAAALCYRFSTSLHCRVHPCVSVHPSCSHYSSATQCSSLWGLCRGTTECMCMPRIDM